MNKKLQKGEQAPPEAHVRERSSFKALLLTNPNYFGNLVGSSLQPVLPLAGSNFYEELACVGYQPQQERLEAVVYVYQPFGYGTDVCGPGTPEYVRFYLSFDGGASWQDQGMTSFQSFNIPEGTEGTKRLEYAVSLPIDPARKFCFFNPLVQVRAILSWNNPPPANSPNWVPIWGNVRNATILVEPLRFLPWPDLLELGEIKLPPNLAEVLDLATPIKAKPASLGAVELARLYRGADVPVHRYAFKELASFVAGPMPLSAEAFTSLLPGIKLDQSIVDLLFPKTDGDTSFEELRCIGLDPNSPDTLVGVVQVKKPSGYSGGPCTDGSREHVTFWADLDGNGSFETCLGTASVSVYDLSGFPAGGVYYAVRLPVDLTPYREACQAGPKVVRVRAILSWNVAAPCANPNHVPVWGNREETLIHIAPAAQAPAGKIAILGGIPVVHIDNTSGLTTPTAVFATNNLPPDSLGRPCPFAGRVTVQGAPLLGHTYLVEVTPVDSLGNPIGAPAPVVTNLLLTRFDGTTHVHTANPVTHRFAYLDFTQNVNSVLAQWDSAGDDKWQVKLSTFNGGGILVGIDSHLIQLDNTAPDVAITITTGAGDCGKFDAGLVLSGTFVARDDYLGSYSLGVEPAVNPAGVGVPVPSSGLVNTAPAPGDAWSLDTTGMKPCGYIIRVVASDRAIVHSQAVGHHVSDSAGFCLE
ncbi:MAG: hypothetical protein U0X20_04220 [Caldilineaceae bacterium]